MKRERNGRVFAAQKTKLMALRYEKFKIFDRTSATRFSANRLLVQSEKLKGKFLVDNWVSMLHMLTIQDRMEDTHSSKTIMLPHTRTCLKRGRVLSIG